MKPLVLRSEEPPSDEVVVVRGGTMDLEDVRRTTTRALEDVGAHLVSSYATLDHGLEDLCRHRNLFRYGKIRTSTFGRLRVAGFPLLATQARPHFDILLPDVADATLLRLTSCFGPPVPNPARPPAA
jgi:hypothetical protein